MSVTKNGSIAGGGFGTGGGSTGSAEFIRDQLESLSGDDRLDASAVKGAFVFEKIVDTIIIDTNSEDESGVIEFPQIINSYSITLSLNSTPATTVSIKINVKLSNDGVTWYDGTLDPYLYVTLSTTTGNAVGGLSIKSQWNFIQYEVVNKVGNGIITINGAN